MWFLFTTALAGSDLPLPTSTGAPRTNPPALPDAPELPAPTHPATFTFDCKVPAEILVDNVKLGQLWFPGLASWRVAPGKHNIRVYVAGTPADHAVEVGPDAHLTVLVGRTGTTVSEVATGPSAAVGPVRVGLRVVGVPAAQVRIDDQRLLVQVGAEYVVELAPGPHPMSLRNAEGTAIWSTGVLEVTAGAVVIQVSEGRMPEVSGGAVFHAGS